LTITARRFRCLAATCAQRIFCERLPLVADAYERRTHLATSVLAQVGVALAGRAGMGLATGIGLPVSRMTILRLVRRLPVPVQRTTPVIGLDDWARRRGHTYGTVVVDLLHHRPVDRLEGRDVPTVRHWLQEHPEITVISRDRAHAYTRCCVQRRSTWTSPQIPSLSQHPSQNHQRLRDASRSSTRVWHGVRNGMLRSCRHSSKD
jgi:transposase